MISPKRFFWGRWLMTSWIFFWLSLHLLASAKDVKGSPKSTINILQLDCHNMVQPFAAVLNVSTTWACKDVPHGSLGYCRPSSSCRQYPRPQVCFWDGKEFHVCCIEKRLYKKEKWFPKAVKELKNNLDFPGCGIRPSLTTAKKTNGTKKNKYDWPWMAAISIRSRSGLRSHVCAGTLITRRHVLTAAHCFGDFASIASRTPLSDYVVLLGVHSRISNHDDISEYNMKEAVGTEYQVQRISVHEDYQKRYHYKDIAMIELLQEVKLSIHAVPVCLPSGPPQFPDDDDISTTVIGWRNPHKDAVAPKTLQHVEMHIVPFDYCQNKIPKNKTLPRGISTKMVCAGDAEGKDDSCQEDSGGPLVLAREDDRWVLVGIVSFGMDSACKEKPAVFTKIIPYLPWITKQMLKP